MNFLQFGFKLPVEASLLYLKSLFFIKYVDMPMVYLTSCPVRAGIGSGSPDLYKWLKMADTTVTELSHLRKAV